MFVSKRGACALIAAVPCMAAAAAPAKTGSSIQVGPNVAISRDRPALEHGEAVICASLSDPNLLIAAATSQRNGKQFMTMDENFGPSVYYSRDNGRTWHHAFSMFDWPFAADSACAYGPDGSAHFSAMAAETVGGDGTGRGYGADGPLADGILNTNFALLDYRSEDGGKSWSAPVKLPAAHGADRQFMAFDTSGGKYDGTYYMSYDASFHQRTIEGRALNAGSWIGGRGRELFSLSRSLDDGRSWNFPVQRQSDDAFQNGNLVVLSDGTVAGVLGLSRHDERARLEALATGAPLVINHVSVITAAAGGEFVGEVVKVADMYVPAQGPGLGEHAIQPLAAGAGEEYKDRLYVAWNDARSGRYEILFSYSVDKGRTWSLPRRISDDRPFDSKDLARGPQNISPWLAVNKQGVVGAVWLDWSDEKNARGYHVRFSASLDGGETWLPSVKISEQPMVPRALWQTPQYGVYPKQPGTLSARLATPKWDFSGGDTTSLTADAAGSFFPVWTDARTGFRQMYTARITVDGKIVPEKRPAPAGEDLTALFSLDFLPDSNPIDLATGVIKARARLRNDSRRTVRGPVVVRVVTLGTAVAQEIRVRNSENGQSTLGALWTFTPLPGKESIAPGESTDAKELIFQIDRLKTLHPLMTTKGFVDLKIVVTGTAED